jgi:hypothetical protein
MSEYRMKSESSQASKVTKVLIHKMHGGRKKDSKFWNDDIDLSKKNNIHKIPIERKPPVRRRVNRTVAFPSIIVLSIIIVLIVARPDLFPFLDYHKIYNTVSRIDAMPVVTESSQKIPIAALPKTYPIAKPQAPVRSKNTDTSAQHRTSPVYASNNVQNDINSNISLDGMVFSWIDKDGKRNFSNTNYPPDNPTLQVQTEINTYRKVTKIHIKGNQIYVPVTLKNNGRSTALWMLLDTGCSHTNVPFSHLNKINAKYGNTVYSKIADGSTTAGRRAYVDMIQVGSQKERNFTVTGSKVAGSQNSGLLGLDFLKRRSFKIDFNRQMLVWM